MNFYGVCASLGAYLLEFIIGQASKCHSDALITAVTDFPSCLSFATIREHSVGLGYVSSIAIGLMDEEPQ